MNRRELLKNTAVAMGVGATSSLMLGALAACDDTGLPKKNVLGGQRRLFIEALAELIIPETDTPGAIAAGVPNFIDHIVSQWYTETERKIFLDGLLAINAQCQSTYGQEFINCTLGQQTQALSFFEVQAPRGAGPPPTRRPSPTSGRSRDPPLATSAAAIHLSESQNRPPRRSTEQRGIP